MNNLLITGGCGFIGSNFIRYLLKESVFSGSIINIDKLTYAGNSENLADIEKNYSKRYKFLKGDICDQNLLSKVFEEYEIDVICHFAAESHVDRSIVKPDAFIQTNIIFWLGYGLAKLLKLQYRDAAPSAMIGASNHFEVAIATATMLFGLSSGAALATVVGVLIEVPVMLMLVRICLRTKNWFRGASEIK